MVYYKSERRAHLKWALGIIILVMGLTLTFSDAYGFNFPSKGKQTNPGGGYGNNQPVNTNNIAYTDVNSLAGDYNTGNDYRNDPSDKPPPPQVPEPGTLILLGSGLAGMLIKWRRKK